jgi:hypothetical protein
VNSALLTPDWRDYFWNETTSPFLAGHPTLRDDHDDNKNNARTTAIFRIAVHIRRGDVEPCKYWRRYLPNSHYLRLIDEYMLLAPNRTITQVTIYSQSHSFESFEVFRERNFTLALDSSLEDVWKGLLTADVVILSKSTFSLAPAYLNKNTVVYTPFWFDGLSHWKTVNETLMKITESEIQAMWSKSCNKRPRAWVRSRKLSNKKTKKRSLRRFLNVESHSLDRVLPKRKKAWWNRWGEKMIQNFAPAKTISSLPLPTNTTDSTLYNPMLAQKFDTCFRKYANKNRFL